MKYQLTFYINGITVHRYEFTFQLPIPGIGDSIVLKEKELTFLYVVESRTWDIDFISQIWHIALHVRVIR